MHRRPRHHLIPLRSIPQVPTKSPTHPPSPSPTSTLTSEYPHPIPPPSPQTLQFSAYHDTSATPTSTTSPPYPVPPTTKKCVTHMAGLFMKMHLKHMTKLDSTPHIYLHSLSTVPLPISTSKTRTNFIPRVGTPSHQPSPHLYLRPYAQLLEQHQRNDSRDTVEDRPHHAPGPPRQNWTQEL
jgi:hypothetical protein